MKTGFSLWELLHRENPVLALYGIAVNLYSIVAATLFRVGFDLLTLNSKSSVTFIEDSSFLPLAMQLKPAECSLLIFCTSFVDTAVLPTTRLLYFGRLK